MACDDNETARLIFSETISSFSFNVKTVSSGFETLDELKREHYDLLIIDWLMPGIDGLETVRKIREDKEFDKLKIIFVSAYGKDEISRQAGRLSVDYALAKPFTYSVLFNAIMNVFGKETIISSRVEKGEKHKEAMKNIRGARILLAEDNEINQQVAVELFKDVGLTVELADNGKIALEKIEASGVPSKYDLVFMDLQMPEMDGYTSTKEIRKNPLFKDLPIIAMTADAMVGIKEKCLSVGMQDFISKPIDPDEVFGTLVRWIKPKKEFADVEIPKSQEPRLTEEKIMLPDIKGIDFGDGLRRVGGNVRLYKDLLRKFANSNSDFKEKMVDAIDNDENELAIRLAHTLKGVSGNLGAKELNRKVRELEYDLKANDGANLNELLSIVLDELNPIIEEINNALGDETMPEKKRKMSKEEYDRKLNELKELLENYDSESVEMVKDLEGYLNKKNELNKLKLKIEEYDFEGALEVLERMLNEEA